MAVNLIRKIFVPPRAYFLIFLLSNILLSYFALSLPMKLWVLLLGLMLPFFLGLSFRHSSTGPPINLSTWEFLPPVRAWVWILLAAAACFVRFYKLTSLSVWPHYDEALWGFLAIDFYHHWDWSLFYQDNPYPSAYFWGLGILFKLFQPSVFLVWFYPALLSIFVVPFGYIAARQYFSKSISFLMTLFLALSFWPNFIGRFGNQQILTLLAEFFLLFLLGRFLKASSSPGAKKEAFLLGLFAALGFYIYISWVVIAFFAGLAVIAVWRKKTVLNFYLFLMFFLAALLFLAPLLQAGLFRNYLRTVRDVGTLFSIPFNEWVMVACGYLSSLFWGVSKDIYSYQPVWGGFLNPVLGSLFMIGLLELIRSWNLLISKWLLLALVLFCIPGVFTHDLEPFRALPMIPFLLVICALGLSVLFKGIPLKRRLRWILALALVVAGLDFYHLAVRYHRIWDQESVWKGYAKPMERYRAFGLLDKIRKENGPGLIYSDFAPGLCDQTLTVADHAFNAAQNPDLSYRDAKWAAVLANANYKPFLSARFPDGRAYALSVGLSAPDGGQMLWVMPVTPEKEKTLKAWQEAAQSFCCFPGRYKSILRDNLAAAYPYFQQDAFLESCYWEKLADLDFGISGFKDVQKPIQDLKQGLERGYGAAHLYQRLAAFHLMRSELPQAKKALEKALAAPLDLTQSRQWLETLIEKTPDHPENTGTSK
jgi:hypothetical protein